MADNPIKYRDFIQPDSSVSDLIKQLEQLQVVYTDMLKKVQDDAKKTQDSIKGVNGATAEGQEQTKKAATEADKLSKAYDDLKKSQSNAGIELAKLKTTQKEQNQLTRLELKLNSSKEGSYNKLSAQYSINNIRLNQMSKAQREGTKAGQELEKNTREIYQEMKRLQENTGKTTLNVGNYASAMDGLPGPLGRASSGIKGVNAQFKKLLTNPIVAIIALVVGAFIALVSAMKRSEEGQDRLNKVMTMAASIFDNVMDILTEIGIALFDTLPKAFKIFINNYKLAFNNLKIGILEVRKLWNRLTSDVAETEEINQKLKEAKQATRDLANEQVELAKAIGNSFSGAINKAKNFGEEITADIAAAKELADIQAQYNKDERKFLVENAKLEKQSADARAKSEQVKLLNAQKGIDLLNESFDLDEKVVANELALAKTREDILKRKSALAVDDIEAKKAIAEAEAEVFRIETRFDELRRQRLRRLNQFRMEALKQERERSKAYTEINKLEQASVIRKNDAIIKSETSTLEEKQAALMQNAQLEAELLRRNTDIEIQELDARKELRLISDEDYALQRQVIEAKLGDEILKINENLQTDLDKTKAKQNEIDKKAADEAIKIAKERYNNSLSIMDQEYDLRMTEIDIMKTTEAEKTRLRLEAEKERLKKILELNKGAEKQLSDLQIKAIENTIKKIDQEIQSGNNKDYDLYTLAGINLTDEKKEAISESTQFAINNVNAFLQSKIDAAQASVDAANQEASAAQSRVDAEIEARNNGYASNVAAAQKELALAKKNQEQALKEQEKAQKAQAAIQVIQQVGNLITASAKIWATLGFPLAIPALAIMWGSFAAAKIKANQVTKQQKFGEGNFEVLGGGSHQSGNDISLGINNGIERRAEGGEALAIIKKSSTRKYKKILPSIISSLNKGVFDSSIIFGINNVGIVGLSVIIGLMVFKEKVTKISFLLFSFDVVD